MTIMSMPRSICVIAALALSAIVAGCAHPISMSPDLAAVTTAPAGATRIDKHVGYHITDADRTREVTTAGGGGDQVRYFPYRDLEPGFYKVLSETFKDVSRIADPKDAGKVAQSGVGVIITPTIKTFSSSDSVLTWPPTRFTVEVSCVVTDTSGKTLDEVRVSGYGQASFDEFKSNFSLAATRASNNALALLSKALAESPSLRR